MRTRPVSQKQPQRKSWKNLSTFYDMNTNEMTTNRITNL